jgi:subfamily B ATP-binding cassette protein MsbA
MGDLLSFAEEALSSIKVTKSLNAEKTIGDRFSSNNNLFSKISTKIIGRKELASPLTEFFSIVILTFIVVVGGTLVINKQMHPSILIAFTLIFSRIITPIQEMITAYYNFQKGDAAAKRVYEILDANERIKEKQDAEIMEGFKDKIEFKDVCFEYDNNNSFALKDINLTIHKGEKVAIVGASGAGKSTLFDLIPRFADVTKGEITIDGVNIKDINIGSLRRNIGFVSQESILFNNTILGNITFGEKDIDIEKVKQVAKISNIDEFINKLPNGYYTNIGDGGSLLSGGQKQRLCIARAIIHNPTILLLDEATSAMDTENEYLVSQAINKAMENRTLIVIAHRLSTITNSDKIIVMDKGMIVEVGTHKSLLEKENGYYSKLVKLQTI